MVTTRRTTRGIEYKLVFADQSVAEAICEILRSGVSLGPYKLKRERHTRIQDSYYDTQNGALRSRHTSLRIRQTAGEKRVQLKAQFPNSRDRLQYLTESWRVCRAPGAHLHTWPCARRLEQALGQRAELALIGKITTERTLIGVYARDREQPIAWLAIDRFQTLLPNETKGLEIEVKGGDPRYVTYLGQCLCNWFGMIRVTSSKLERRLPPPVARPLRLLLDMDPGVDDALALLYAGLSEGVSIEGISIVGGNAGVMQCARNAYRICAWMRKQGILQRIPPIAVGRDLSRGRSDATNVHGADALGDLAWGTIDEEAKRQTFRDAVELQRSILSAHHGEVTVVATGPCSNLAELIRRDPDALRGAREVIVMGGVFFNCGNRSPGAEFNIHADSASARSLLEFCRRPAAPKAGELRESVPLTFVGLDVTHRVVLWRTMVEKGKGEVAKLVCRLTAKYMDFYSQVLGPKGCPLHDPLAVALALHPEYCVRERYHVEIVTTPSVAETDGITIADYRPAIQFRDRAKELTQVCVSVDSHAFLRDFCARLGLGR